MLGALLRLLLRLTLLCLLLLLLLLLGALLRLLLLRSLSLFLRRTLLRRLLALLLFGRPPRTVIGRRETRSRGKCGEIQRHCGRRGHHSHAHRASLTSV